MARDISCVFQISYEYFLFLERGVLEGARYGENMAASRKDDVTKKWEGDPGRGKEPPS
jgi:hypothetical protein